MNREERRNLEKQGVSKETIEKLNLYDKPCTVLEVVKLSRSIAEDVVNGALEEYTKRSTGTIVALTLQTEILKKLVMENNLITEEKFNEMYLEESKLFEEKQRAFFQAMKEAEEAESPSESGEESKPNKVIDMSTHKNLDLDVTVERSSHE